MCLSQVDNWYFQNGHYQTSNQPKIIGLAFGDSDNVPILISAGYDGRAFEATRGTYRDCILIRKRRCVK